MGPGRRNFVVFFFISTLALCFFTSLVVSSSPPPKSNRPSQSVFRGISHIHTAYSHDSDANLDLVLQEAKKNNLDFAIITDHNSMKGLKAYRPSNPSARPLLIFGDEVTTTHGHLIGLGIREEPPEGISPQDLIDWIHAKGGFVIVPHPFSKAHPWGDWEVKGWDGLEIYNFGHELFDADVVDLYLRSLSEDSDSLLKSVQKVPQEHFSFWDGELNKRMVVGLSGTDAHLKRSQKNFSLALQSATLYVLAKTLGEKEILEAIRWGKVFTVFETRGRAVDFSFWAQRGEQVFGMGETIQGILEVSFQVHLPAPAKIRLIHNSIVIAEQENQELVFTTNEPGAYRVEVYQGEDLWIFSNPIYLKA